MGRLTSFLGLALAGLLSVGCDTTTSRCESLCTYAEDCDDEIDLDDCIQECTTAFDEPGETCAVAFEVVTDCIDTEQGDCEDVNDDCDDEIVDFSVVCDEEIEDMDIDGGGGSDPRCDDYYYNTCTYAYDGECDESSGLCSYYTDYSDCYCF